MIRIVSCVALVGLLSLVLPAGETSTWTQSSVEDFLKGKREKIALRSDGALQLAPALKEILDPSSNAIWAIASDSQGTLYTASPAPEGGQVRVHRVVPGKPGEVLANLEGLTAFSMALDNKGRVYVAVSPQSKIFRIENGQATVFCELPVEYVWDMRFASNGDLYVATGDKGVIYKVNVAGEPSVFFETEETHVRTLLLDDKGNVYAGTSPGALVLRVHPNGEGFVLYQSDREEITALASDSEGNLYAAALGTKRSLPAPRITPPAPAPAPQPQQQGGQNQDAARPQAQQQPAPPAPRTPLSGGSQVIRLDTNGFPSVVWESDREYVYALALNSKGRLVAGTGNSGELYEIEGPGKSTALLSAPADQITALLPLANGGVAFATSNIGRLYQAGPELEEQGYIESDVLDSSFFAHWGRMSVVGEHGGGTISVSARSGNVNRPQKNWTPWSSPVGVGEEQVVNAPPARYFQWRAELRRGNGDGPVLREVTVAYRNRNVPPRIVTSEATPPNYAFPPRNLTIAPSDKITLTPLSAKSRSSSSSAKPTSQSGALGMNYSKGSVGVRWLAEDANNDNLTYRLEIRQTSGGNWLGLVDNLNEPQYSWDSTSWPDGRYEVRITASDKESNPPDEALEATAVTDSFLVDNSKPEIAGLSASRGSGNVVVRWKATDALSQIRGAEYSLNGKDWTRVEPKNGISDARSLDYELTLNPAPAAGAVFTVRVRDEFDNEAVASVVVQ